MINKLSTADVIKLVEFIQNYPDIWSEFKDEYNDFKEHYNIYVEHHNKMVQHAISHPILYNYIPDPHFISNL